MLGSLLDRSARHSSESRYSSGNYLTDLAESFVYGGVNYLSTGGYDSKAGNESLPNNFESYARQLVQSNGVVFACMATRLLIFSEARFQFRNRTTKQLFGTPALERLERPWHNGSTGELLAKMEQDVTIAGNSYWTVRNGQLRRMDPRKTTIVQGSRELITDPEEVNDLDLELVGYRYEYGRNRFEILLPHEVAHYSPIPDPLAVYRGMSWLTPVLREVEGDTQASTHKLQFFKNAATPNLAIVFDKSVNEQQFKAFKAEMEAGHRGVRNAYKSLYLGGGADVKPVGMDFKQMDFRTVQGAGETRIAAAAGVPPVIVGLSEGLQAATYSNYSQARRRLADGTIRPLWRMAAQALETLVPAPSGAELWTDTTEVAFLREDEKDQAEIDGLKSRTIRTLVDAGYKPDAVAAFAETSDPKALIGQHSGLYSVQLQPAGTPNPGGRKPGADDDA